MRSNGPRSDISTNYPAPVPQASVTIAAPAKLNLALAVAPPEPAGPRKGWHRIASWVCPIQLAGRVTLTPASASSFSTGWMRDAPKPSHIDWSPKQDLAFRAHRAVEAHVGRLLPAALAVHKASPVGAGLGGGSSEATAVIVALDRLFNLKLSRDAMRTIAAPLGSDVPLFIDWLAEQSPPSPPPNQAEHCPTCLVHDFGDRVEPAPSISPSPVVLVIPAVACNTRAIYTSFDAAPPPSFRADVVTKLAGQPLAAANPQLFNDLESPATRTEPALPRVLQVAREAADAPVHLTGSGSACFALAESDAAARAIATRIEAALAEASLQATLHLTRLGLPTPPIPAV